MAQHDVIPKPQKEDGQTTKNKPKQRGSNKVDRLDYIYKSRDTAEKWCVKKTEKKKI